jgi:CheY-like chemotaxis protein
VLTQLLAFARSGEPGHELVEVDAVVQAGARALRQVLGGAIDLRLDLGAPGARVRADAAQLQQIVLNLASNAHRAMPQGGLFTLETRVLPGDDGCGEAGVDARVRLRASDTGHGMDEPTLARAFEPFFTTKRTGEGSGLGLSMVYGAVRQAGGRIELDSAPGKGTRVEIDWPLAAPARRPAAEAKVKRVLVVDDERLVRMALRHYLEKMGYQVIEAASAEAGLELLSSTARDVQLLVSDVMLPGMKGPELVMQVHARWPQLPTLLMSGHANEALVQRGMIAHGTRVLRKPFTPAELRAALERCPEPHAVALGPGAFGDSPSSQPTEYTTH